METVLVCEKLSERLLVGNLEDDEVVLTDFESLLSVGGSVLISL